MCISCIPHKNLRDPTNTDLHLFHFGEDLAVMLSDVPLPGGIQNLASQKNFSINMNIGLSIAVHVECLFILVISLQEISCCFILIIPYILHTHTYTHT